MKRWQDCLKYDPIPGLISCGNELIIFFSRRDLLDEKVSSLHVVWNNKEPIKLLGSQRNDGSWKYHQGNPRIRSQQNYNLLETYRYLGFLVEKYGFNKEHPALRRAAEYVFTYQSPDGDIRGIYGNQYTPNYTGGIMELLIKAGYAEDKRIENGFKWLLSIRQNDGGWAIPLRTAGLKLDCISMKGKPVEPVRSRPFSHLVTGCVLRAFASHPRYKVSKEAKIAGELLVSRLFKKDAYPDRSGLEYWINFRYPFWFTDLLSALDSLSKIGYKIDNPRIEDGINWFVKEQNENGLWELKIMAGKKYPDLNLYLNLAICRALKRFYEN